MLNGETLLLNIFFEPSGKEIVGKLFNSSNFQNNNNKSTHLFKF